MTLKLHPSLDQPDAELMRLIARGDMNAFDLLIGRHQKSVRLLAYRLTRRDDAADEIAQDTFLRVLRAASGYQPTAAFSTFLHRIVVNLCLDRAKRPRLANLNDQHPADTDPPAEQLEQQERAEAIRHEIDVLPERQRIALVLHRFQGLTHSQIAQTTGWSESAIEALLVRAYAQLRERLKKWRA